MKHIMIDRSKFTLVLYNSTDTGRYKRERSYIIAIGALGFESPVGMYEIRAKARNPDWLMPNSSWVKEEDRGKVIPGGDPANPLKVAFLSLGVDGLGIHGTGDLNSLGTAASHGCIRMSPEDIEDLYGRVGNGTPVYIHE